MSVLPDIILWTLVGLAAVWDSAQRRVPNGLILAGLVLGCALQAQAHGFVGLGHAILGAAVPLAILVGPFHFRLVGGADVKLVMVVGAFLGWAGAVHVLLLGTVLHGFVSLIFLFSARFLPAIGAWIPDYKRVPHAIGFAVATVVFTATGVRFF